MGKKIIAVMAISIGAIMLFWRVVPLILGRVYSTQAASIGVIGGADGPTSVYVAGRIGQGNGFLQIAAGVLLLGFGIWGCWKKGK